MNIKSWLFTKKNPVQSDIKDKEQAKRLALFLLKTKVHYDTIYNDDFSV